MSELRIENLEVRDQHRRALLAPLNLVLEAGRTACLIGESGAGKSLVCAAIAGTLPPDLQARGRIWLDDCELTAMQAAQRQALWSHVLFLLPQEPWTALAPTRSAFSQVSDMPRLFARGADRASRTAKLLERVGLVPSRDGAKRPAQLSGGMAQRVAMATTLGSPACLILVDEPTKGLDMARRQQVEDGMRPLLAEGRSVLLVTHDLELARRLGDEILVMRDGLVVERGPASAVLADPHHAFTRALLDAEPESWMPRHHAASAPLLSAVDLAIRPARKGPVLACGLNFSIPRGGLIGLVGPSGSGKTTLGDTLLGLYPPAAGSVAWTTRVALQKLYQDPGAAFAPWRPIRATISDALAAAGRSRWGVDALCRPICKRLGLGADLLDRRPDAVSSGELQRLSLARALLCHPGLIFADEPTSRLDAITQKSFISSLCDAADDGTAIVLASHNQTLITKVADRVVALA